MTPYTSAPRIDVPLDLAISSRVDGSTEHVPTDVVIVGGGLAGIAAAIAAARRGCSVALVHNRTVLGGNSSSEIRVWVVGATAHGEQLYARETGIMGELWLENQFQNPDGNPYLWDLVLREAIAREPRIALFLDTDVREVEADGPADRRVIRSVTGWSTGSERVRRFTAPQFVDASGDGIVGALAGAEFRVGREGRDEFGEEWAPEQPDAATLGSTLLFYVKDAGHPVPFVRPSIALDLSETTILRRRVISTSDNGCDYWWIEWGGELDVVRDNDLIRDRLQGIVYGIWDHIKNSGAFDADTLTLEWVGSMPGKREYRRFVGEYTMTQHDVIGQTKFPDAVGFGGWSIDLHPPGGVYADEPASLHRYPDGVYSLPLRSFFSRNVENRWMAGRTMSATHIAFGSTRVMATCAVGGEAAGLGAAEAVRRNLTPRQLVRDHGDAVRRALIRADASIIGVEADDPDDLALTAQVSATSWAAELAVDPGSESVALDEAVAVVIPVSPVLTGASVALRNDTAQPVEVRLALHATSRPQNYLPAALIAETVVRVPSGESWMPWPIEWMPEREANGILVVGPADGVHLRLGDEAVPGVVGLRRRPGPPDGTDPATWRAWKPLDHHRPPAVRLDGATAAYAPGRVCGGYARPWGGPHLWMSGPLTDDAEPTVTLEWKTGQTIAEIAIVFDDDVQEDLINLHHHRTASRVLPSLVRDYAVEVRRAGEWIVVAEEGDNRRRHRRHAIAGAPVDGIRIRVRRTNGASRARIVSVRAYATPDPAGV